MRALIVALVLSLPTVGYAESWIFRPSYFTGKPPDKPEPVYVQPYEYVRYGYRNWNSWSPYYRGYDNDYINIREYWIQVVK